jgi:guanylate kinase
MKSFDLIVAWKKLVRISYGICIQNISFSSLAEAINQSFNEIKTYVENRRRNLLQSLKTTKDYKLKILNDQLNLILSKFSIQSRFFIC